MNHVTLLAAKALQSVDYNLPCDAFYDHPENHGQYLVERREWLDYNNGVWPRRISAPSILETVLWLWEKYKIWTSGYPSDGGKYRWDVSVEHKTGVGSYLDIADEGTATDILAAYSSAIVAACEWAKNKKA